MKLIILHGNGLTALAKKLSLIKQQFDPLAIAVVGKGDIDMKQIELNLLTQPLFSQKKLVILEDIDEQINLNFFADDQNLTLLLKYSRLLPSSHPIIKLASKFKAEVIAINEEKEISIFPFLDMLAEKNPYCLPELDKMLERFNGQYVLTMIFFMLRRFIMNPKKTPEFIRRRLEKQRINFSREKISFYYKKGLELDLKIKSGLIEEKIGLTSYLNGFLTQNSL